MPGTRNAGLLALGGIALAALLTMIGHVEVNENLSPWSLTVSDFAVSDRGGVIDVAMVVLALATAVLLRGLRRTGLPGPAVGIGGRLADLLLGTWVAGLMLAAVVPTNEPGTPMTTAAYVHRYASVVAFLALPVAGWLLARRGDLARVARGLRGLALSSLVLAAVMVWSAYPGDRMLIGLIERVLILTEVALIAVVAGTVAWSRRPAEEADHAVVVPDVRGEVSRTAHHNCMIDVNLGKVTPARGA
ncbi:DUF998 domain-containing protein [Micromonospora sp. WMMD812]|uniref:DUF998 domain-containing protein n=1 Tax=Micromonospora sp. WMMD812 TaxID=3015152 RepID=UPI00248B2706|nr:DUF998 domain-containing protein [Micromonospora sp. WMMD812]WBB65027.1 DUF998 domain-containing protein [Micromonospora sp. WMMD812]